MDKLGNPLETGSGEYAGVPTLSFGYPGLFLIYYRLEDRLVFLLREYTSDEYSMGLKSGDPPSRIEELFGPPGRTDESDGATRYCYELEESGTEIQFNLKSGRLYSVILLNGN